MLHSRCVSACLALLTFFVPQFAYGQSVSLGLSSASGSPGATVNLSVLLDQQGGAQTAGLQWKVNYSTSVFSAISFSTGAAASGAEKSLSCDAGDGTLTCVVFGLNTNPIPDGTVAIISLTISAATSSTSSQVLLTDTVAVSADGNSIPASGGSGTVSIIHPQPVQVSGLACSPSTMTPPASSTCTVTLSSEAPSGGFSVALASSNAVVAVPDAVTVPSGSTSTTFSALADVAVTSDTTAVLTASANGSSQTFSLTIKAPAVLPAVSSLSCAAQRLIEGESTTCTVGLTQQAPAAGVEVALSRSSSAVTIPNSLTVPQGESSAVFTATAEHVTNSETTTISASAGGSTQSVTLTVDPLSTTPPVELSALTCNPTDLGSQTSTNCAVALSGNAPTGGSVVTLSSSHGSLKVPGSVTVPAGSASTGFTATVSKGPRSGSAVVTASLGGSSKTVQLTWGTSKGGGKKVSSLSCDGAVLREGEETSCSGEMSVHPVSISCSPNQLTAGDVTKCEVLLNADNFDAATTLLLTSSSQEFRVPASITVRPRQRTIRFQAEASPLAAQERVAVTATLGNESVSQEIDITSNFAPVVSVPGPQVVISDSKIEFEVAVSDPTSQVVSFTATGLPPGAVLDGYKFAWRPTRDQIGEHAVTFTAGNSLGLSSAGQVEIAVVPDKPIVSGLVNSASHSPEPCSPGGLASILGSGFTRQSSAAASSLPLPTSLGGVRVRVNGESVLLLYASGTLLNIQCPFLLPGTALTITVESDLGVSKPVDTIMAYAAPGIFRLDHPTGTNQGLVVVAATGELAMLTTPDVPNAAPARLEDFISIFAAGLGPVDSAVSAGQAAPSSPPSAVLSDIQAAIGDVFGTVHFAGLAPGFVGLYQVNVEIPSFAPVGDEVPVSLLVKLADGKVVESNKVTIAIDGN
jgi:uncharacterized protein (TIGR03437 family)